MTPPTPPFIVGDRIRLVAMPDEPKPLPVGSTGTVTAITYVRLGEAFWQIVVDWDCGRGLMLSVPPDVVEKV